MLFRYRVSCGTANYGLASISARCHTSAIASVTRRRQRAGVLRGSPESAALVGSPPCSGCRRAGSLAASLGRVGLHHGLNLVFRRGPRHPHGMGSRMPGSRSRGPGAWPWPHLGRRPGRRREVAAACGRGAATAAGRSACRQRAPVRPMWVPRRPVPVGPLALPVHSVPVVVVLLLLRRGGLRCGMGCGSGCRGLRRGSAWAGAERASLVSWTTRMREVGCRRGVPQRGPPRNLGSAPLLGRGGCGRSRRGVTGWIQPPSRR